MATHPSRAASIALVAGLCIAVGLPALLAYNVPPSPTALNQVFAICGWGLTLGLLAWHGGAGSWPHAARATISLQAALWLVAVSALLSWLVGTSPSELSLPAAAALGFAALVLAAGASARPSPALWAGLFAALVTVGTASVAIGLVQVFAPDELHSPWIARSGIPGRAVGNLRQPNHLSTLLLWSATAVVPLLTWASSLRRALLARLVLSALFALMAFGVVLSGSRTGLLGVSWLVAWGILDRSLTRTARALLIASPVLCLASSLLLSWSSSLLNLGALGVSTRLSQGDDISGARFAIWRDALALVARQPWLGVGFGEFNIAWTLTPFPERDTQFFDHTHNLPLQLAVELGVPAALLVLALLLVGLGQAFARSRSVPNPEGVARRAALVMVLLMTWHSQLEYPLWYLYFLLPTAFAWGIALQRPVDADARVSSSASWLALSGGAMMLAAVITLWDYQRVVAIFSPSVDEPSTLAERIVEGRHSWFFAHHADYALVTTLEGATTLPGVFRRSTHFLLDTRLLIAWAQGLAASGDLDKARYVAARLREFRSPGSETFFAPCTDVSVVKKPFQCEAPTQPFSWRELGRR